MPWNLLDSSVNRTGFSHRATHRLASEGEGSESKYARERYSESAIVSFSMTPSRTRKEIDSIGRLSQEWV